MDLVVDANILFSILIKKGKTEDIFFSDSIHLFAPEFIIQEFVKYESFLLRKTGRTPQEFEQLITILKQRIVLISNKETEPYIVKATILCPDPLDADYFALALKLNCAVWSNDKLLKQQSLIKIYNTQDLISLLF